MGRGARGGVRREGGREGGRERDQSISDSFCVHSTYYKQSKPSTHKRRREPANGRIGTSMFVGVILKAVYLGNPDSSGQIGEVCFCVQLVPKSRCRFFLAIAKYVFNEH